MRQFHFASDSDGPGIHRFVEPKVVVATTRPAVDGKAILVWGLGFVGLTMTLVVVMLAFSL